MEVDLVSEKRLAQQQRPHGVSHGERKGYGVSKVTYHTQKTPHFNTNCLVPMEH